MLRRGGGVGAFLERYVNFFHYQQECKIFPTLRFLFSSIWYFQDFISVLGLPPPPHSHFYWCIPNTLQCITPRVCRMRSHIVGVVKPIAQGWGYSKATLSSQINCAPSPSFARFCESRISSFMRTIMYKMLYFKHLCQLSAF